MQIPETEIIVSKDGAEILRKTARPGDYVIGRDEGCEVQVEAEQVAPRHAQFTVNFDHALIEDLGSESGTRVNGKPVKEPTRLWPNQKIQIGASTVELRRVKSVLPPDVSLAPQTAAVQRLLPEEFLHEKKYDIGGVVAQGGMGAILNAKEVMISGEDQKWVKASARIEGNTVIVSSTEVPKPIAVRYAWANNPEANLYNGAGLPAAPFRTDMAK